MPLPLFGLFFVTMVALLWCLGADVRRLISRPRLRPSASAATRGPLVSLLIPARNEERAIARCVRGALAQTYADLEVIVVDDGSTDATAQILAQFPDPRLRVLSGRALPAGWVGKCNVCQQLGENARGEWLLFLDADTAPQPELVRAVLEHAQRERLDMLTVFPFLELGSFWERVIMPAFVELITLIFPFHRVAEPDATPEEMIANGQCIFLRRSAYTAIGGHTVVRAEILEDVMLAQTLRRAGCRIGAVHGPELLRVRMYTNGAEVVAGLSKNAAAGYRSGGGRSFWGASRQLFTAVAPLWLIGGGVMAYLTWGATFGIAALLHGIIALTAALGVWAYVLREIYALPWGYALLHPLGVLSYMLIALRAMWQVARGRGVQWKGRRYTG